MRPAILCCRAFSINAPTNIANHSSQTLIELLFRLFFSVVALLWRDNLDGKRDKQDEDFGARDLIKMY